MVNEQEIEKKDRKYRRFCSYYTKSEPITKYMVSRLGVQEGDHILEPCAGDGVFIDEITNQNPDNKTLLFELIDLNKDAVVDLREKFGDLQNANIRQADFLFDNKLNIIADSGDGFDKVIANPPYGAWQSMKKREELKSKYGGYVKETYTLFIKRCIKLLKDNGRMVFIVPDTFLALNRHKEVRKIMLEKGIIEELCLMPSDFFPGVNFNYANLCIFSFRKTPNNKGSKIHLFSINDSVDDLLSVLNKDYGNINFKYRIPQKRVKEDPNHSFFINSKKKVRNFFLKHQGCTVGDIASCVTGFYSGDNKRFLAIDDKNTPRSKGYKVINQEDIKANFKKIQNLKDGLNEEKYIPILKGGRAFLQKQTNWYVRWSKKDVDYYKNNPKSRFQNSDYYFEEGIGVPMVKSSRIYGVKLDGRLFDQSIVGVFPNDESFMEYLLLWFNSSACTKLISTINHTANNSANYIKRIPVKINQDLIKQSKKLMRKIVEFDNVERSQKRVDDFFNDVYGF